MSSCSYMSYNNKLNKIIYYKFIDTNYILLPNTYIANEINFSGRL